MTVTVEIRIGRLGEVIDIITLEKYLEIFRKFPQKVKISINAEVVG